MIKTLDIESSDSIKEFIIDYCKESKVVSDKALVVICKLLIYISITIEVENEDKEMIFEALQKVRNNLGAKVAKSSKN